MKREQNVVSFLAVVFVLLGLRFFIAWDPISSTIGSFANSVGKTLLSLNSTEAIQDPLVLADSRVDTLAQENEALRNQLELSDTEATIAAEVIRMDVSSYRKTIWINKGSNDGLSIDDAVVHSGYLFGKVISTTSNSAEVQVITDPEFTATAQYEDEHGVIKNSYGSLLFDLVPKGDIEAGKTVVTDGIDGVFKPGIPVAIIANNITKPGSVFYTYNVYVVENPINVRFVEIVR